MNIIEDNNHAPIKLWTDKVPVESGALTQLKKTATMPFIFKHIAVMPDVHIGIGATVGSVIPTTKAVIPAAVGVDIGCGMIATRLNITANDLPDNLKPVRSRIEKNVPHGRSNRGKHGYDTGAWGNTPKDAQNIWMTSLDSGLKLINQKHPKIGFHNAQSHLGTLGTGNHFIEICLDNHNDVWIMLHSGSRGVGNRIGTYFISKAKEELEQRGELIADKDLAYLTENTDNFNDYVEAVAWAQSFAFFNRIVMFDRVMSALAEYITYKQLAVTMDSVNCHHNYLERETHFGESVWITRKGAINAEKDKLGIIPGSMGAKSYIVRGKGNPESFNTCSHGAGRRMSRTQAKQLYTVDDHINATQGVECKKDSSVVDETPMAYKNIDDVMASQTDLVDIIYTLKQIICVKG